MVLVDPNSLPQGLDMLITYVQLFVPNWCARCYHQYGSSIQYSVMIDAHKFPQPLNLPE
jgi:hypothetical protein